MQELFQVLIILVPVLSAALFIKCAYFCFRDGFKWRWSDLLVTGSALAVLVFLWQTYLGLALAISIALNLFLLLRSIVGSTVQYLLINGNCAALGIWNTLLAKVHFDARRGFLLEQAKAAKLMAQGDRKTAIAILDRRQSELPFLEWYSKEMLILAGARSAADDEEIAARAKMLSEVKMDSKFKFAPLLILALAQMKAGEPEEALASLGKIDSFVPRTYKNVFEVGLRSALGCTESMEAPLRHCKAPEFAAAYFRGLSDFARGNANEARANWKRAIELIDSDPRSKALSTWKDTCEKRLKTTNREAVCIYTIEREKRLDYLLKSISTPRRRRFLSLELQNANTLQSSSLTPIEHHQCAGFFRRFVATSVDCGIVFLLIAFSLYVLPTSLATFFGIELNNIFLGKLSQSQEMIASTIMWCAVLAILACTIFYGPLFESSRLQATPGKLLLNLNVVNIDGSRMNFIGAWMKQAFQCFLGGFLGICFPVYAATYVLLFGKHKQTIYDKIFNRVVIVKGAPRTAILVPIVAALVFASGMTLGNMLNFNYQKFLTRYGLQGNNYIQSGKDSVSQK